jgi:hypothetical protein
MPKVRLNIEISQQQADLLDALAEAENATRSEMVRRAIYVLQAFQQQKELGRPHLGFVRDAQRLDAEILGILQAPAAPPHSAEPEVERIAAPAPLASTAGGSGPLSMEAAMARWSPHLGGRAD